jgi:hypothetical protein
MKLKVDSRVSELKACDPWHKPSGREGGCSGYSHGSWCRIDLNLLEDTGKIIEAFMKHGIKASTVMGKRNLSRPSLEKRHL